MPEIAPSCFVLMPFGKTKKDPARPGKQAIDFDRIYDEAIGPAIKRAGMEPIRADKELVGGIIHKPMFERLLLCDFAVADLTLPNPNVYYELGVRHSTRRNTTLLIFASHASLPFDVAPVRAMPYDIGGDNSVGPRHLKALSAALTKHLRALRQAARAGLGLDSPIHQLVGGMLQSNQLSLDQRLRRIKEADSALYEMLNVYAGHEKTDVFSKVVAYNGKRKEQLAAARATGGDAGLADVDAIRTKLGVLEQTEAGVIVDLFLSYRALSAWSRMIVLYDEMPAQLQRSVLVREQYALALNRCASRRECTGGESQQRQYRERASRILEEVTKEIGPNPETQGLLGRVFKDRWSEARGRGAEEEARGHLKSAIDAYVSGFRADWRDAYPGINALTLLDAEGSQPSLQQRDALLPLVRFAVEQKLARAPDYWDHATLLELAVHAGDAEAARAHLEKALASPEIESFMPETTATNLGYLSKSRAARALDVSWLEPLITVLLAKHGDLKARVTTAPAETRKNTKGASPPSPRV